MNHHFTPAYLETHESGALQEKIDEAYQRLFKCDFCPNQCHVNRHQHPKGVCKGGLNAQISSYKPFFNDDKIICGHHGSGTIFFAGCHLGCNHCDATNSFSPETGTHVTPQILADFMIRLQDMGCHNINLVSPTHLIYPILAALPIAIENGLNIPLIYNSNGYESLKTLQLLDGIIDIYSPDLIFMNSQQAQKLTLAENYRETALEALTEMFRQVGDLEVNSHGIAMRGLLVRHFTFKGQLSESKEAIDFVYRLSPGSVMHILSGYHPYRCITKDTEPEFKEHSPELIELRSYAQHVGLHRNNLISH